MTLVIWGWSVIPPELETVSFKGRIQRTWNRKFSLTLQERGVRLDKFLSL